MPFWFLLQEKYVPFFGLNCGESMYILCAISDFGRGVDKTCALQGFCC